MSGRNGATDMKTIERQGVALTWGRNFDVPPVSSAWGARAIFRDGRIIDIVGDRQDAAGPRKHEIVEYLNTKVPPIRELQGWLNPAGDDEVVVYEDDDFIVVGSPQSSYGYFYLRAWFKADELDDITINDVIDAVGEAQAIASRLEAFIDQNYTPDDGGDLVEAALDLKILLDGVFTNLNDMKGDE